jgi:hypothetical protein
MPTPGIRRRGILYPTGWIDDHRHVDRVLGALPHPIFGVTARPIRDSGKGKTVLFYQAARQVVGRDLCHFQTIGDCVSHGYGLMIDMLKCMQIIAGQREKFSAETATEVIYGGSRIDIGGGQAGRGDGSVGAWASQYISTHGTLARGKYGNVDLSEYDGNVARAWGAPGAGVPVQLDPIIREHPVRTISLVQNYNEARDAIANGYPVVVCCTQGFNQERDQDGFARQVGTWGHCQCFIGVDDAFKRPGLLCMNSWGPDWITGPKRLDQPDGSYWVDAEVVDAMLGEMDSFAGSGFVGFPAQEIDYDFLAAV